MKKEKKNKNFKKIEINKPNKKPLIILLVVSFIIALLSQFLVNWRYYVDENISLNNFTNSFQAWIYSEVLVDWNKAIATHSWKLIDAWIEKTKRDIVILPTNDWLKDLWLLSQSWSLTKVEVKDKTSEQFWAEWIPTILMIMIFLWVALFLIWRMWWMTNNAMSFGK